MLASVLTLAVFSFSGKAHAQEMAAKVKFSNAAFHDVLLKCPESVWPGLDWSTTGILLISREARQVWYISAKTTAPDTMSLSALPKEAGGLDDFKIFPFRGKTVLALNLDKYQRDEVTLPGAVAVHELFHRIGQANWKLAASKRGDFYPLLAQPRIDRGMLLSEMQTYAGGDTLALPRAAFWYDKWKTDAPEEIQYTTDAREGTAKYVERLTVERTRAGGCAGDVSAGVAQWIRSQNANDLHGLDGEGYTIGAVAGFLLDRAKTPWKEAMKNGATPLELLMNGAERQSGPEDFDLHTVITARIDAANVEIGHLADPFAAQLKNPDYYRVIIPDGWTGGYFGLMGAVIPRASPAQTYLIFPFGQEFQSGKQNWMILTNPSLAVVRTDENPPCASKGGLEFLVSKSKITSKANHFSAHTANLDFEILGKSVARDGLSYLCPATN